LVSIDVAFSTSAILRASTLDIYCPSESRQRAKNGCFTGRWVAR
jgi:hypothetical protein